MLLCCFRVFIDCTAYTQQSMMISNCYYERKCEKGWKIKLRGLKCTGVVVVVACCCKKRCFLFPLIFPLSLLSHNEQLLSSRNTPQTPYIFNLIYHTQATCSCIPLTKKSSIFYILSCYMTLSCSLSVSTWGKKCILGKFLNETR